MMYEDNLFFEIENRSKFYIHAPGWMLAWQIFIQGFDYVRKYLSGDFID